MKKSNIVLILIMILFFANLVYSLDLIDSNGFSAKEQISPFDRIKPEQIHIYNDRIIVDISGASYARYANTNSMDPTLDEEAVGIEIPPSSEKDIYIGDIITYEPTWTSNLVVHRVIEVGEDEQGWYAYTKGDNSSIIDPGKIRFNQVKYILIGVFY